MLLYPDLYEPIDPVIHTLLTAERAAVKTSIEDEIIAADNSVDSSVLYDNAKVFIRVNYDKHVAKADIVAIIMEIYVAWGGPGEE